MANSEGTTATVSSQAVSTKAQVLAANYDSVRWHLINDIAYKIFDQVKAHIDGPACADLTVAEHQCLFGNIERLVEDFWEERGFISIL
jgi:hypothetical protein